MLGIYIMWPYYFKDRLLVGNPDSDTAIVTLWTPMNILTKMVDISKLSIIGQLYTKRGINYLLRNIFLNPRIKRLMITGADLTGSGEALISLSLRRANRRGDLSSVGMDWIDPHIDKKYLKLFFQKVKVINAIGPLSSNKLNSFINESKILKPWSKPIKFPESKSSSNISLPGEETMFVARGGKVWQTWIKLLRDITHFGRISPMIHQYGGERISELINLTAVIYNENPQIPEIPQWLPFSKDDAKKYVKSFLNSSRGDEDYTYGERLKAYPLEGYMPEFLNHADDKGEFRKVLKMALSSNKLNQQRLLVEKLKSFPENKGALAILWEPIIDNFGLREIWRTPCLVLVQAMIRDSQLYLTAYFRSHDMFGGWPLNAFGLRAFQQELIDLINKKLDLGPLTMISHSAHIYESSWPAAEKIASEHWIDVSCEWDRRGNLDIAIDGKYISAKHLSPDGIPIAEYRFDGTKPYASRHFCFQLENAGLFSTIGNAMYAARNIERAATAIKLDLPFVSDQPLSFDVRYPERVRKSKDLA